MVSHSSNTLTATRSIRLALVIHHAGSAPRQRSNIGRG